MTNPKLNTLSLLNGIVDPQKNAVALKKISDEFNREIAKDAIGLDNFQCLINPLKQVTGLKNDGGYRVFSFSEQANVTLTTTYVGKKMGLIFRFKINDTKIAASCKCSSIEIAANSFDGYVDYETAVEFNRHFQSMSDFIHKTLSGTEEAESQPSLATVATATTNPNWATF